MTIIQPTAVWLSSKSLFMKKLLDLAYESKFGNSSFKNPARNFIFVFYTHLVLEKIKCFIFKEGKTDVEK